MNIDPIPAQLHEEDEEEIDIAADIEQLRLCYDRLRKKKEQRQKLKLIVKDPSVRQMELYKEGKKKLMIERSKEDAARDDSFSSQRRDPTPIPICDRLYEEGMAKVMAEKLAEEEAEERLKRSSQTSGNPSPIPICDRLYEEGMTKLLTEKMIHEKGKKVRRRSRHSISPIPICDRLYEEGMSKMMANRAKSKDIEKLNIHILQHLGLRSSSSSTTGYSSITGYSISKGNCSSSTNSSLQESHTSATSRTTKTRDSSPLFNHAF